MLECISKVMKVGLFPKVVICDLGANNRAVFKDLDVAPAKPYFIYSGCKIFAMFDPPHLVKSMRNHFRKTGFAMGETNIRWQYVEEFYELDSSLPIRMAPKLTRKHIDLPPFSAMRVKLATQVLSHSVAAGITYLCSLGKMDEDAIHKANFIEKMDCLFNVFKSSGLSNANKFRTAIQSSNNHFRFLGECSQWFFNLKPAGKDKSLPCLHGWQLNIASISRLWAALRSEYSLKFFITNRLNQDCRENFFSVLGQGWPPRQPRCCSV